MLYIKNNLMMFPILYIERSYTSSVHCNYSTIFYSSVHTAL